MPTRSAAAVALLAAASCAAPAPPSWGAAEVQLDSRGFSRASVDGQAALPGQIAAFGFLDIEQLSPPGGRWFWRAHLRREAAAGIGPVVEGDQGSADDRPVLRGGVFVRSPAPWPDLAAVHAYPLQDGGGALGRLVLEHRFGDGPVSAGGFADLRLDDGGRGVVVAEVQIRHDLELGAQVFVEVKVNELREDDTGLGVGVRWTF